MSKLRVFVVDDHPVVRKGLQALIDDAGDMAVAGEACDGETAVRQILEVRPDVVVMDVSMAGMSGIQATAQIRAGRPEVRVVALTAHEDRAYLQQMLAAGAAGYVLKRAAADDLVGAIRRAAAGDMYLDPAVARLLEPERSQPDERTIKEPLSAREEEVLQQIAHGYSNNQIATRLKISVKTVETYKYRAMEKLGAKSRVEVVRYAAERGWLNEAKSKHSDR